MELSEVAPPGREKQVKALKKEFPGDKEAPYKIAWAQYNKKKKAKEEVNEEDTYSQKDKELKRTSAARKHRYKSLHSGTNTSSNVDVNENVVKQLVQKYSKPKKKEERKPSKAMDAGARARRVLQRKEYRDKVSSIIPAELENQKDWDGFKNLIG